MTDRISIVHENLRKALKSGNIPYPDQPASGTSLTKFTALDIFRAQCLSRLLDRQARLMQADGTGYYTIGSSGHEGMAAIAAAVDDKDPAFLHYRDAAFFIRRAHRVRGHLPVREMVLSFAAAADDPVCSGRHKVLGGKDLMIPPQTSTIASHLPKTVGAAYSIGLNKKLRNTGVYDPDSIVIGSFGDASVNHSTALGAINSALWSARHGAAMPLLLICEDNGIGISTRTPKNWIADHYKDKSGLKYFSCDGLDLVDSYETALQAARYVRRQKSPAFLHFQCIRLFGHAGADMQDAYMNQNEIERIEAQDPLITTAARLHHMFDMPLMDLLTLYDSLENEIRDNAENMKHTRRLETAQDVMESLVPPQRKAARKQTVDQTRRQTHFGADWKFMSEPQHMARIINWTLHDLMLVYPEIVMVGEDIGPKGGVYNVTAKCHAKFGPARVMNAILDEQSILGLTIGMAQNGVLPIPEIQFLAYLHNAEDQIRGEAATLPFFSNGQFTNPMVVRIAGLAYQRGFGGHFHNDNSVAVIRDIPGIILACPSNGRDAALMLRESVRLAREEQRVVIFLEPIALYMTRDLHAAKDGLWSYMYPHPRDEGVRPVKYDEIGQFGTGEDLAIISFGNGIHLSLQAVKRLEEEHDIACRVIDLRWLSPLNIKSIRDACAPCRRVLIVDETRETGSVSEEIMTRLVESDLDIPFSRVTAKDSFIPLGKAFAATLPSVQEIYETALKSFKKGF